MEDAVSFSGFSHLKTVDVLFQCCLELGDGTHGLQGGVHIAGVAHVDKTNWQGELFMDLLIFSPATIAESYLQPVQAPSRPSLEGNAVNIA